MGGCEACTSRTYRALVKRLNCEARERTLSTYGDDCESESEIRLRVFESVHRILFLARACYLCPLRRSTITDRTTRFQHPLAPSSLHRPKLLFSSANLKTGAQSYLRYLRMSPVSVRWEWKKAHG